MTRLGKRLRRSNPLDHEESKPPLYPEINSTGGLANVQPETRALCEESDQHPEGAAVENGRTSGNKVASDVTSKPVLKITQAAYAAILEDLAGQPFQQEQGGILLGPEDAQDLVVRYVKDEHGEATFASFTIDVDSLNAAIRKVRPAGLTCVGIVHSHPDGFSRPSGGDIQFLERIFAHPKNGGGNGYFLFPIVMDGKLHPYVIDTSDVQRVLVAELVLV